MDAAHGGIPGDNDTVRTSWLKFVREYKNWTEAQSFCKGLGGNLFSGLDGSKEQLDFLWSKMEMQAHWLGIYTDDFIVWKSVIGAPIANEKLPFNDQFIHQNVEPNFYIVFYLNFIVNIPVESLLCFVCDMVH